MTEFSKRLVSFLQNISLKCWESSFYRCILFSIATVFAIIFMGYYFGTFDQSIHIPFLKKFADPSLYPNDRFLDLRFIHPSYFWFLFIPFYRLGLLEISMFITYVGIIYFTFSMIWKLTKTLFNNPLVSFLSVIVFILPHIGFGLLTLIEFSLLNRTFVLPFLLLSIDLYLNKRYNFAYAILGILYNLHALSVNFVLAMFLFDTFLRYKQIGWKKILLSFISFIVLALPVLVWKMKMSPVDFTVRPEWFSIVSKGFLYHLFVTIPSDPKFLLLTLGGVGTVVIFYIGFYFLPKSQQNQIVHHFILADLLIMAVWIITSSWLPIIIIIQSQIIRVSIFFILFGYLYFIHFLVVSYLKKENGMHERFILLFIITLLSGSPILIPVIWILDYSVSSIKLLRILTGGAIVAFFGFLIFAYKLGVWSPGIYIFAKKDADYDVQMWARTHTPKKALFITPPTPWLFYDLEWRVISERSTVVHLGELAEAAFAPKYIPYWKSRFESLAPGALQQFHGDAFANKEITKKAFYRLSTYDIKQVGKKYGASYLVVEKPHIYGFREVYENSIYRVYDITK